MGQEEGLPAAFRLGGAHLDGIGVHDSVPPIGPVPFGKDRQEPRCNSGMDRLPEEAARELG